MEYATEYRLRIHFGGRDGIHGIDNRDLGRVSEDRADLLAREMLRDHAVRVEILKRQVEAEWTEHVALGAADAADEPSVVAHYMRHYSPYTEEFYTVDEAFRFLAAGEDNGNLASDKVVDGDTVYERGTLEFEKRLREAWDALVY